MQPIDNNTRTRPLSAWLYLTSRYFEGKIQMVAAQRFIPLPENQSLCDYFNFSWKSFCPMLRANQKEMNRRYSGIASYRAIQLQYEQLNNFQKTDECSPAEQMQLETLVKHRKNLYELTEIMDRSSIETTVREIQSRVDALSLPSSPLVIQVLDAQEPYTSFSFPGGSSGSPGHVGHSMLFEMRLAAKGYSFIIYDRANSCLRNIPHLKEFASNIIHINEENQKRYSKTVIEIQTTKEKLLDREFLTNFILYRFSNFFGYLSADLEGVYTRIKSHFKVDGGVPLMMSTSEQEISKKQQEIKLLDVEIQCLSNKKLEEEEDKISLRKLVEEKLRVKDVVHQMQKVVVLTHDTYHSSQKLGTCSVSCLTGIEKQIASPQLRRKIKLHLIMRFSQQLLDSNFSTYQFSQDKHILLQHSHWRIQTLQNIQNES